MPAIPIIYVVDDDASVRRALGRLIRAAGFDARVFGSIEEFLASGPTDHNACLVSDVRLPRTDAFAIPKLLADRRLSIPFILVTALDTDDTRSAAKAMGASAFFRKPVDDQALLDAIVWALSGGSAPPPGTPPARDGSPAGD